MPDGARAQAPQYTVTVLGPGNAVGVNASGEVVGESLGANITALAWQGTTQIVLGSVGSSGNVAFSINASGQIAGYGSSGGGPVAVVWNGTTPTVIGSVVGSGGATAYAINASGQVVGNYATGGINNPTQAPAVWNGTTLTLLPAGNLSSAYAINASGEIAGYSGTFGSSSTEAVVWNGTTPAILGSLGGTAGNYAYAINNSGVVAGSSSTSGNAGTDAVVWNGTTPTALGSLGGNYSYAYAINDSGQVVGESCLSGNATADPFLYTNGQMYDLNSLIPAGSGITNLNIYYFGDSINDSGQIAASGTINGQNDALLLTPQVVPEPGSAALLTLGAGALLGLRRRPSA